MPTTQKDQPAKQPLKFCEVLGLGSLAFQIGTPESTHMRAEESQRAQHVIIIVTHCGDLKIRLLRFCVGDGRE